MRIRAVAVSKAAATAASSDLLYSCQSLTSRKLCSSSEDCITCTQLSSCARLTATAIGKQRVCWSALKSSTQRLLCCLFSVCSLCSTSATLYWCKDYLRVLLNMQSACTVHIRVYQHLFALKGLSEAYTEVSGAATASAHCGLDMPLLNVVYVFSSSVWACEQSVLTLLQQFSGKVSHNRMLRWRYW
jgi:hypothetical protein